MQVSKGIIRKLIKGPNIYRTSFRYCQYISTKRDRVCISRWLLKMYHITHKLYCRLLDLYALEIKINRLPWLGFGVDLYLVP